MKYVLFIKEYREIKNLTQQELAALAKVKQSYISQLENNHPYAKSPTLRVLFRIAKALETCPHLLVKYDWNCKENCLDDCEENFF